MATYSNMLRTIVFGLISLCASVAQAQIFTSYPYTLTNGTLADATQVMADFNAIATAVNTNAATNGANSNITGLKGLSNGTATLPAITFLNFSNFGFYYDTTNNCLAVSASGSEVACIDSLGIHNLPTQSNPKPNDAATVGYTQSLLGSFSVGGRLTLATGTPVMATSVTASGTIYFTPYLSASAVYSDGTALHQGVFAEVSQALNDTTLSPAAAVANATYDIFYWYFTTTTFTGVTSTSTNPNQITSIGSITGGTSSLVVGSTVTGTGIPGGTTITQILSPTSVQISNNATVTGSATFTVNQSFLKTFVISRGPAWSSSTSRGYTLSRLNGFLVNTSSITNGPGALAGVYLGTIRTDSAGATVSWIHGTSASGGGQASLGVWNMFNRIQVSELVNDNTASWSYSSATFREAHGSTTFGVAWIVGLLEDGYSCSYTTPVILGGGANEASGIGINGAITSPTVTSSFTNTAAGNTFSATPVTNYSAATAPQLGLNTAVAVEYCTSCTFFGAASGVLNSVFTFQTRM